MLGLAPTSTDAIVQPLPAAFEEARLALAGFDGDAFGRALRAVSENDLNRVADKYFTEATRTVVVVNPKAE